MASNRTAHELKIDNAIAGLVAYRTFKNDHALLAALKALSPVMPGDELFETINQLERDLEPCGECKRINCQCDQARDDLMSMDTHMTGWGFAERAALRGEA